MMDLISAVLTTKDVLLQAKDTSIFLKGVIDEVTGSSKLGVLQEITEKALLERFEQASKAGVGIQYVLALRKEKNIMDILIKANEFVIPDKPNEIKADNDFFCNMLEYAKNISNDEMQTLIAKILAGEYNNPDTYHMSTLQTLKTLGLKELALFEKLCGFMLNHHDTLPRIPCYIFNTELEFLPGETLDFCDLNTLQGLGLFLPNEFGQMEQFSDLKLFIKLKYFEKEVVFKPVNDGWIGTVVFSPTYQLSLAGKQIVQHLKPRFNPAYYQWLLRNYRAPGCIVSNSC